MEISKEELDSEFHNVDEDDETFLNDFSQLSDLDVLTLSMEMEAVKQNKESCQIC